MIVPGDPTTLGATPHADGVNFAVHASAADAVELCLFDARGAEIRHPLPAQHAGVWHGFVPGARVGEAYGYRVHGPRDPARGLWHNPAKLLLDPYARELTGAFRWHPAVYDPDETADTRDSAPHVYRGLVTEPAPQRRDTRPLTRWQDTVIYEAGVRMLTQRLPAIAEQARGRFAGVGSAAMIDHLKSLGITTLELMPVQAWVDEAFLVRRGLANAWGYNTLAFFAPMPRLAGTDPRSEFRQMVDRLHDANIEVVLDVVYNHTAEGGQGGPTLCWRGLDNLAYYRVLPDQPGTYVNDTGTGNTLNADHPVARTLVVDSLRYWASEMGVDGFRFDLAPILGRHFTGYSEQHPLLQAITHDRVLRHCKLIAEPWDIGPGGYQLGGFPPGWSEWNDRYRDTVRQYWQGGDRQAPAMARRLHGSADIFESASRLPGASINFVTAHDGFTLRDLVSYENVHNHANGEDNRDGHQHNYSGNHGVEGDTDDPAILALRRRQRLNLLATLLVSQGTPMLLAGDELGRTQGGNNNAYAQDNATLWIDWPAADADFLAEVRALISLRRDTPLLRQRGYRHGHSANARGRRNIEWLGPDGAELHGLDWHHARALMLLLTATDNDQPASPHHAAVAVACNPTGQPVTFSLPAIAPSGAWALAYSSDTDAVLEAQSVTVVEHALACLRWPR